MGVRLFKCARFFLMLLPCLLTLWGPTWLYADSYLNFPRLTADRDVLTGIAIVNPTVNEAKVVLTAFGFDGIPLTGAGITNPVTITISANQQFSKLTVELFGSPLPANAAWFQASSTTDGLSGFFLFLNSSVTLMDGADVPVAAQKIIFNDIHIDSGWSTELNLINPGATDAHLRLALGGSPFPPFPSSITIPPHGAVRVDASALFTPADLVPGVFVSVESDIDVAGLELVTSPSADAFAINARRAGERLSSLYFLQISVLGSFKSFLSVVNYSADPVVLTVTAFKPDGLLFDSTALKNNPVTRALNPNSSLREDLESMFGFSGKDPIEGWIMVKSTSDSINGFVSFGDTSTGALAAVTSPPEGSTRAIFSQIATSSGFLTGMSLLNPSSIAANVRILALQKNGTILGVFDTVLQPSQRFKRFLGTADFIPQAANQSGGFVFVRSDTPIYMSSLITSNAAWVSIPAQPAPDSYNPDASISPLKMNPPIAILPPGASQLFHVDGLADTVVWKVNGTLGGAAGTGNISSTGKFTAPRAVPARQVVTITAETPAQTAGASADILDQVPFISGLSVIQSITFLDTLGKVYSAELAALASDPLPGPVRATASGNSQIFEVSPFVPKLAIATFPGEAIPKIVPFNADDGKQYLLLAAQTSGRIIRLNPVTRDFRYVASGLDQPSSLVIDPTSGDLLIVERDKISSIARTDLEADLAVQDATPVTSFAPGPGASSPIAATLFPLTGGSGIVADRCTRTIYFTNAEEGTVSEFNPATGKTRIIVDGLSLPGQMLGLYRSEVSCPYSFQILVAQRNANQVSLILPGSSSVIDWAESSGITDLALLPTSGQKDVSGVMLANQPIETDNQTTGGNVTLVPFSNLYSSAPPNPPAAAMVESNSNITLSQSHSPEPVGSLDILTFGIEATNRGPADASGVTITDTLPVGVLFVSAFAPAGSCAESSGVVHCHLGTLRVGGRATVTVQVVPGPIAAGTSATIRNTATVISTEIDTDPSNTSTETAQVILRTTSRIELSGLPAATVAGTPIPVTLTFRDQNGDVATGYAGRVILASSDKSALIPPPYTFAASDAGSHIFSVTFRASGPQTLTVLDDAKASLNASQTISVSPAAAATLVFSPSITAPAAGVPFSLTVGVRDEFGNSASNYRGTVTLSASPTGTGETFVPSSSSGGSYGFSVTLNRSGIRTLNAAGPGGVFGTATVTVTPAELSNVALNPASASVLAGTSQAYSAAGFDKFNNSLGDITSSTTFSISPDGSCTGTVCTASVAGPHTITATSGGKTATVTLTVTAGALNSIVISPASTSVLAGTSQAYSGAGFDKFNNSLGDITSSTTFSISPDGSCTGTVCTATVAGPHTITAASGGKTASAILAITAGALNSLVVSPASASLSAGTSQTFSAAGFDKFSNSLGDITSSTAFTISPNGSCTGAACAANVAGPHTVTAASGGKTATATLAITAGALSSVVISPSSASLSAGTSQTFSAAGFDKFSNSLGDITSSTTFSISPDGSCTGAACTANVAGPHTVTAASGGKTASATLAITAGALNSVVVSPASASLSAGTSQTFSVAGFDKFNNSLGDITSSTTFSISPDGLCTGTACSASVVGPHTVTATSGGKTATAALAITAGALSSVVISPASASLSAGTSQTFSAAGFDKFNNSLGDITSSTTFSISPDGSCTGTACSASVVGPHMITATSGGKTATATLTVTAGALNSIVVSPASASLSAGTSQTFSAAGFDKFSNSLGDITSSTAFTISPDGSCTGTACSASVLGPHTITATRGGKTATATLIVTPGALNSIVLSPASATIAAGASQAFTATGFDQFNNPLGNLTSSVSFSISPDGSCTGATCGAVVAGPHVVTGAYSGRSATASLLVASTSASAFRVSAPASVTAGIALPVTVTAVDAFGNTVSTYSGAVTLTASSFRSGESVGFSGSSAGVYRFSLVLTQAGTRTLIASASGDEDSSISGAGGTQNLSDPSIITPAEVEGIRGTAYLAVVPAAAASLDISSPASVAAGSTFTITLRAQDAYGNLATGYSGVMIFFSSDPRATLPPSAPLNSGRQTFTVTLRTPGGQTIRVVDPSAPGLSVTSPIIVVYPATEAPSLTAASKMPESHESAVR